MKKVLLLLTIFLFPLNVLAYSNYIIPGGNTLGINVSTDGIMIVGFYKIGNNYNKSDLKVGDYIIKINNIDVNSTKDLTSEIEKYTDIGNVNITYKRDNKILETTLNLIKDNDKYKTGLYVKDSIKGIGTLSYIDPETKIYGALGHEIFFWRIFGKYRKLYT